MKENVTTCIKRVGGKEICSFCGNSMIKYDKSSANKNRFKCKLCNRTQVENYTYKAYSSSLNSNIILLTKEGVGIRSISRLLNISTTTLLSRIVLIAKKIQQPIISKGKTNESEQNKSIKLHP